MQVQDQDGRSALSVAVTCETESAAKLVTLLLDNGANPNLADRDNMTPLLIAAFEGITFLVYQFLSANHTSCSQLSHGIILMSGGAHDGGILQS